MDKLVGNVSSFAKNLRVLQNQDKIIVCTNGCFDLLHAGHLHLLNEAKKLGDILIVLLNTDDSIKRLKGKSRPIENLTKRIENLKKVATVDYIISFSEDTPEIFIQALIPDILVKGEDYKGKAIAGEEFLLKNHKKVVLIPLLEGYSTTNNITQHSI